MWWFGCRESRRSFQILIEPVHDLLTFLIFVGIKLSLSFQIPYRMKYTEILLRFLVDIRDNKSQIRRLIFMLRVSGRIPLMLASSYTRRHRFLSIACSRKTRGKSLPLPSLAPMSRSPLLLG